MQGGVDDLAARLPNGALIGVPADYSGVPMALTLALLRRKVRDLRLFCLPTGSLQVDVLIGAGAVVQIETSAVSLGEFGLAPCFSRAVEAGTIKVKDSTCPAMHAQLTATERGIPFMPMRGLLGSDLLAHRADWRVVDNPLQPGDPIVLVPATRLDVAIFHAPLADQEGNVWIGRRRELATLAHAAERSLVTVERVVGGSFFEREETAAGALSSLYVEAIATVPQGAWPLGLGDRYPVDGAAMRAYAKAARTAAGFRTWLDGTLAGVPA
ncbi:MAG: CoA synthetase [Geminicoccaceae bacterium]|nr:MAG: CoA synthetase [Geminicoccaceae bacterium]